MRRALSLLVLCALSLVSVLGCNDENAPAPLKKRPVYYHNVVSLSPGTTEILMSPFGMSIIGRTAADNWPVNVVDKIPVVASTKPDYEKLAVLRPDLIVYDSSLYNAQDQEKLRALGAGIYKIDAKTVNDFRTQLVELATLTGQETRASDYIDRITVEMNTAKASPPQPTPKVAVMMPSTSGSHYIAGTDSFLADVVRQVGGDPVGPKADIFVPVSPESLVSMNPDVIIVNGTKTDYAGALALLKDPRFQTVKAIKNKRVKLIESDVLLRRGGRVDLLIKGIYRAIL